MRNAIHSSKVVEFCILLLLGGAAFLGGYAISISALAVYALLFSLLVCVYRPKFIISPLAIIFVYYFVFFVISPSFAEMHSADDFSERRFYLAFGMIFLTHAFASYGAFLGEQVVLMRRKKIIQNDNTEKKSCRLIWLILFLYISSSSFVYLIIQATGGISRWIEAPGDAFLNRAGSGIYVIMSHMSTFFLAGLVGYASHKSNNKFYLIFFFLWLMVTAPVHGSKQLVSMFLILSLIPWVRSLKSASISGVMLWVLLGLIFFLGLYLRNMSWITLDEAIPYALNYFTTLRNLLILIDDFEPGFLHTFFLPFNKFLTPFGASDTSLYYDMNHMLTDKYFPAAWEIRATEQWPVEADLYLNFYFFGGLPLVFLYMFFIGWVHGRAHKSPNLGIWIVSILLTFSIISHLRGSIYNHVDFYFYPMLLLIYIFLRKYSLEN